MRESLGEVLDAAVIGLFLATLTIGSCDASAAEEEVEPPLALQVVHARVLTPDHGFLDVKEGVYLNKPAAILFAMRVKGLEVENEELKKALPVPPMTTIALVAGSLFLGAVGGAVFMKARLAQ